MNAKGIFTSKPFWFNLLALVVIIANAFGFADFSRDPAIDQYALIAITVINIVLQLVTKRPVKK